MANSTEDETLETKIANWLGEQGYRLEYMAYQAFKTSGINSVMSTCLKSSEGKSREIDVTAWAENQKDGISVRVLCECKYSAKPWLLLGSDLKANFQRDWHSLPHSSPINALWKHIHENKAHLAPVWHFSSNANFAHSVIEGLKKDDNRDFAFNALQKIAHAAWDWVESEDVDFSYAYRVAIPCIIVDAPLMWVVFDGYSGQFKVEEIPYGRILWNGCRSGTLIDVVQINALGDYVATVKNAFSVIENVLWYGKGMQGKSQLYEITDDI